MKTTFTLLLSLLLTLAGTTACQPRTPEQPSHTGIPADLERVPISRTITDVQPMTGLVLWPSHPRLSEYQDAITLEYSYCLPSRVVTGKQDSTITYDWTYLERILDRIADRGHQAILRFRYEYPGSTDVDGQPGTTAVPQYIKDLPDYHETYSPNPGGDGPTYYADWTHPELQWFTRQFYTDFAARYNDDPRIAFLEIGFGHWSEYHIYGTPLRLGQNFPSKAYQADFLSLIASVMRLPWAISIDAADDEYTPIAASADLLSLPFGLFDDSFMHAGHEIGSGDGYNEQNWRTIGQNTRWQRAVCGGEISYYTDRDQTDFLNPQGLYGTTYEQAAAKYHISFMIANDAPAGPYGTVERFRQAGTATGYQFRLIDCAIDASHTYLAVINQGTAPLYRDAYFTIANQTPGSVSLRGLCPGDTLLITLPGVLTDPAALRITSPHILPTQQIDFAADLP